MYIRTIIFFLLCGSILLNSHAANINQSFQEANDLIIAGNFKDAKKILLDLEGLNPNNYQIINNLAYIEAKQGNIDEAINILRKSISKNKEIDIIYKNLTNLYAFQANILYEEALSIKDAEKSDITLSLVESLNVIKTKNVDSITSQEFSEDNPENKTIDSKDIEKFIFEWAGFWQNKNYQEYFNCYADEYYPKKFKSRIAWMVERKKRIQNKKNIEIKISNTRIFGFNNEIALISFTQAYNSDSFSDVVKKHTLISVMNDDLKITGEYILK